MSFYLGTILSAIFLFQRMKKEKASLAVYFILFFWKKKMKMYLLCANVKSYHLCCENNYLDPAQYRLISRAATAGGKVGVFAVRPCEFLPLDNG